MVVVLHRTSSKTSFYSLVVSLEKPLGNIVVLCLRYECITCPEVFSSLLSFVLLCSFPRGLETIRYNRFTQDPFYQKKNRD